MYDKKNTRICGSAHQEGAWRLMMLAHLDDNGSCTCEDKVSSVCISNMFNFLLEQHLALARYYGQTLPFGNASFDKDCHLLDLVGDRP